MFKSYEDPFQVFKLYALVKAMCILGVWDMDIFRKHVEKNVVMGVLFLVWIGLVGLLIQNYLWGFGEKTT